MAYATPDRIPSTPPAAPLRARTKKPSSKVLETQQSLRARTTGGRSTQTEQRTTTPQPTPQTILQPVFHHAIPIASQAQHPELPVGNTGRASALHERGERDPVLKEIVALIASLKETIAEQSRTIANKNDIIETMRTDLAAIKAEQGYLKSQNAELQEAVGSLRA